MTPAARSTHRVASLAGLAGGLLVAFSTHVGTASQQTGQQPAPGQQPSFRATVDVVSLNVTVAEVGTGPLRYVSGLEQDNFDVFEDGVKQDITVFNKTNSPIALSLLIDSSASMEQKMAMAQEAAIGFVRRLREQDLAEIVDFDDRAMVTQGFTNEVPRLERAIRSASAGGPTSLYQALYVAINGEFKKLKKTDTSTTEPRRQAVVLLSDGLDTTSLFTFEDIMDIVKRSETAIYTIGLRDNNEPESKAFNEARFVLRQLSQETGGRPFFPNQLSDLAAVYGEIADELSSQYTIGYASKNQRRDGSWRRVIVQVKDRKNVSVRTKQGYFAARN